MTPPPRTPQEIATADARDPLAFARARFSLPQGMIYLDGNSLGALPAKTPAALERVSRGEWGGSLISGWNAHDWIGAPQRVGGLIAPLIGAEADEVIACDSTSVNIYKAAAAALAMRPGRAVILADADEFPTDLYMLQGLAEQTGASFRAAPESGWERALGEHAALFCLSAVHYRTGRLRDMAAWTARAHAAGALMLWDLSHAAGAIRVDLNGCDADFAVGCGYKYLNGGPGAPAYLYVARRHQAAAQTPLPGWMGHAAPFAFEGEHRPAPGMARWLAGTPPILGLAALEEGVRTFDGVDMAQVREKSLALGELFLDLVTTGAPGVFEVASAPAVDRGSQVSLRHPDGYALVQALIAAGVVGDFRAPDLMRFGFTPLYLSFTEVAEAARRLVGLIESGAWREPRFAQRLAVT
ncbi:kynureninase [soil metagenome]